MIMIINCFKTAYCRSVSEPFQASKIEFSARGVDK